MESKESIYTKIGIRRRNSIEKMTGSPVDRHKETKRAQLIRFDSHGGLCQSEENSTEKMAGLLITGTNKLKERKEA